MSNEILKTLEQLHAELAKHPQLDAKTIDSLRTLIAEIPAAIENSEAGTQTTTSGPPRDLSERVQELITGFEVRHPQLTATLTKIADGLADLGI